MKRWFPITIKIVLTAVVFIVLIVALVFGARLYQIVNPPINHTLFWVNDSEFELKTRIEKGADVNKATYQGRTPLHLAAQWGELKSLSLLISSGADILAQDNTGQNVLHYAVNGGSIENIRLLLSNGAQVNASDDFLVSPLHRAVSLGASRVTKGESITLLLNAGADINARTSNGQTPVHWAVTSYSLQHTLLPLLKAGANPNTIDISGESPLHLATTLAQENAVVMLIDYDVDTSKRDQNGKTAYDLARLKPEIFSQEVIKRLKTGVNESTPLRN